jgi:acetyl esterase/lipase
MSDLLDLPVPKADHRVAYGALPQQFGDLFLPKGAGPHPLVLALHGGFWRAQYDLAHLGHLCAALAHAGFAVWSVEYRRIGQEGVGGGGGYPGTLQDVSLAADFLPQLRRRFPALGQRTVSLGHSAGGQLALWLAGRHHAPEASGVHGTPLGLAGVVALAPVSDLAEASRLDLGRGVVRDFLGGAPEAQPERYAAASPSRLLPLGAPQIVVHGTEDDTVPYALSQAYVAEAQARGDRAELRTLQEMGHFEPIDPRSAAWPVVLAAVQSLVK